MKCIIGSKSLPAWYRIIHKLVEIGDNEVYFDFAESIVTLSTANAPFTTFAMFILFKPFFESYSMTSDQPEKITIPPKIVLKPFRNQKMAKTHVSTEIQFDEKDDFITITSEGKSHASSTYRLGSTSGGEIELDCDPYTYKNCLKMDVKVLSSCLSNFSHMKGLSDMTLKIIGQRVTFKNTATDVTRKDGSVVTEFNLTSHDFMDFDVHVNDIQISFCLREFKLFASLAEQLKLPVNIHFQGKEDPVIVVVKMETFEARLCLSTREGDPFNNLGPTPSSVMTSSSVGRISSVSTQNSAASSRNGSASVPQQEVNRRRENATSSATPSGTLNTAEPPAAKRIRRTDAAPPLAELSQPRIPSQNGGSNDNVEMLCPNVEQPEEADPIPVENIGQLVDRLEKRNNSPAYKAIQKFVARPRISMQEYLKKLPGHDVVLCPDSEDEEDED